jgi:predicted acetylornithine/succinylornithine family transaminase
MTVVDRAAAVLMDTYRRRPVVFVRGEGSWLWDEQGNRYLDCLGGIAVTAVGHANPAVTAAVTSQAGTLIHTSNLFHTEPMVDLAERLAALAGLDRVFLANCGATANETALKLARLWGRSRRGPDCFEVVSLLGSFHGRTLAALASTGQPGLQSRLAPMPTGFSQVAPGSIEDLEQAVTPTTAAVMVETIQGEGGVVPLDPGYLRAVRALCDERDVLMIVDDVQAGVGRTGSWFSWQRLGFAPDVATVAKALGNGLPVGACLARDEVASAFRPGDHGTTFGGGPVVCRAALAVLDEIESRDLLANCRERSEQFVAGLSALAGVIEVRGRGLLLAARLDGERAASVTESALDAGLVVNAVRPNAVRFAPPLTITAEEVDRAIERFAGVL